MHAHTHTLFPLLSVVPPPHYLVKSPPSVCTWLQVLFTVDPIVFPMIKFPWHLFFSLGLPCVIISLVFRECVMNLSLLLACLAGLPWSPRYALCQAWVVVALPLPPGLYCEVWFLFLYGLCSPLGWKLLRLSKSEKLQNSALAWVYHSPRSLGWIPWAFWIWRVVSSSSRRISYTLFFLRKLFPLPFLCSFPSRTSISGMLGFLEWASTLLLFMFCVFIPLWDDLYFY